MTAEEKLALIRDWLDLPMRLIPEELEEASDGIIAVSSSDSTYWDNGKSTILTSVTFNKQLTSTNVRYISTIINPSALKIIYALTEPTKAQPLASDVEKVSFDSARQGLND